MSTGFILHLIDNAASQQSIVEGSRSIAAKFTTIDGVSRGDVQGPWSKVGAAEWPAELLRDVALSVRSPADL